MEFERVKKNKYGFYELKDKSSEAEIRNIFENRYYQESMSTYRRDYTERELQNYEIKNIQIEYIINKNMGDNKKIKFLDIGCGEGFASAYFLKKDYDVKCLDFSDEGLKNHNPELMDRFQQGDALDVLANLIKDGEKYDVIYMCSVLEMMYSPRDILNLIRKLLKDTGIIIISGGNDYSKLQLKLLEKKKLKKEYWLDIPGHPFYFNLDGLVKFVNESDFECVDSYAESLIDFGLINDLTNYYEHPEIGKQNFEAYVDTEQILLDLSLEKTMEVKKILGSMGLGRTITAVFRNKRSSEELRE